MQNYMIKNTLRSTIFILGLIAILLLSSRILSPKSNNEEAGMIDPVANGILGEPTNTIDVLILGDSESYCAMIPLKIWEEHGITSYCCGTSGQLLSYSEQFLHKTFSNQNPKIVVLETDAIFRKISFKEILLNHMGALFSVFNYHNRWKTLKENDFTMTTNYTSTNNTKGYLFADITDAADASGYMKPSSKHASISSRNLFYIERMKEFCDEKGAKFVFVSTPSTVNWNFQRHNAVEALANQLNVEYIDMNVLREEIPIDWNTDTRDKGDHLNHYGAKKVTKYLGDYLASTGLIDIHTDHKLITQWNEAAKNFNSITNLLKK